MALQIFNHVNKPTTRQVVQCLIKPRRHLISRTGKAGKCQNFWPFNLHALSKLFAEAKSSKELGTIGRGYTLYRWALKGPTTKKAPMGLRDVQMVSPPHGQRPSHKPYALQH